MILLSSFWRKLACAAILVVGFAAPIAAQQTPVQQPAAPATQPVAPPSPGTPAAATPAAGTPVAPSAGQPAPSTSVATDDLQKLVDTLKSDVDRAKLVAQLQAMIDAQHQVDQQPGLLAVIIKSVSDGVSQMAETLSNAGTQLADLSSLWQWFSNAASDTDLRARLLEGLARVGGVLGCGLLAMLGAYWLLGRLAARMLKRLPSNWGGKIAGAALTFVIHAAPLAAFAAAAFISMPFLLARLHLHLNEIVVAAINAVLITGLLIAFGRAILQPSAPHVRILHWSDETTVYADVWLRRFVVIAVVGYIALETAGLFGLPPSAHAALQRLLGLLISILLVVVILQNRHNISHWLKKTRKPREAAPGSVRTRLANHWHIIAIVYVLFVFVVWLLRPAAGLGFLLRATFLTALVAALGIVVETALERLLNRFLTVGKDIKARFPAMEKRVNRYMHLVFVALRSVVGLVVFLIVLSIWGVDSFAVLVGEPGRQIVGGVVRIVAIVIGAMVVWELAGIGLERYLERTGKSGRLGTARVKTMLPVARHLLGLCILILAALMLLSEIGIAIGPLLAGAGIVGLAIGLGAQSLVKDLIAGFSLIMEDALAVGDTVKIGEHIGIVEQLTIRSLRLRDSSGTVHYIPLGSVTVVQNMTKDFAYVLIDCKVQYNAKVDDVVRALTDVGEEIAHDSAFSDRILAPIEVFGLEKFADGGYVVRARLKTKPGAQWAVNREFNKRLKQTLDERNIAVNAPPPQMVLGQDVMQAITGLRKVQSPEEPDSATTPPGDLKPA